MDDSFVVNEAGNVCTIPMVGGGEGVVLFLYIDDMMVFGTNLNVIKKTKDFLSHCFEMKDLGSIVDVILNMNLLREDNGWITLLQSHYVEKILSGLGIATESLLQHIMILVCCFKLIKWLPRII
jgi:hypothetical protein